jgi:hypothetical protein
MVARMRPHEDGATRVDAYLDELLAIPATREPRAFPEPIEPELEAMAQLMKRALARFHPSFRFEERLADRLALEARTGASPAARSVGVDSLGAGSEQVSIGNLTRLLRSGGAPLAPAAAGAPIPALELRGRGGLLLGGAIASGVSLAGAALIARARRARAEHRWQELG